MAAAVKIKPTPESVRNDLTGMTFGRLTVLGFGGRRGMNLTWKCRCECGNEALVYGGNLAAGRSTQCQDCARQTAAETRKKNSDPPDVRECRRWWEANRDSLPKAWRHDFGKFWQQQGKYKQKHNGNYLVARNPEKPISPTNARWLPRKSRLLKYNGKWVTSAEYREITGHSRERFRQLWNRQNGLCQKCGRRRGKNRKKYTTCSRCPA